MIIEDEVGEIHKKIRKEKKRKKSDWNLETTQNPDSSKRDDESLGSPSIQLRLLLLPCAHYELNLDKLRRIASPLLLTSGTVQVYSRVSASGGAHDRKNVHN